MHLLTEVEGLSLRTVQYCVFDEADRLFEMGFADQIRAVLAQMGEGRQTLLFSATLPAALAEFARAGLKDPAFVRLDADTKLSPDLRLCFATLRRVPASLAPPTTLHPERACQCCVLTSCDRIAVAIRWPRCSMF